MCYEEFDTQVLDDHSQSHAIMNDTKPPQLTVEIEKIKEEKPKDVYGIVYMLFFLLGIVHFLPSTFFITAHDYWMYKFRNTSFTDTDSDHRTYLQKEFSPALTISLHLSSVTSLFLTLFHGHRFPVKVKLYGTHFGMIFFLIILAVFINIDTDDWQMGFFIVTMILVVFVNAMTSIFGMGLFTVLSCFSNEQLGAYLNGQGVAAIFTSLLQVLSLAVGMSTTKSALVYFWIAIGLIIFCLTFALAVKKNNQFFNYYCKDSSVQKLQEMEKQKRMTVSEIIDILKYIWPSLGILLFYLLTMNPVHTSITSLVVSEGEGNGDWNDIYFVPVTTFLMPAVCEIFGRILGLKIQLNVHGAWFVLFSAIRVVIFVPLLMLCNAQPREHLSVVFPHDYQYILIMIAFSFSNGYLLSTGQLLVPKSVPADKIENAFHMNIVSAGLMMGALSFISFISVGFL